MTRRERLERKIDRRRQWADKAVIRSAAAAETSHSMMSVIPMGQPILIGHHSEKRDRAYRDRAWSLLGKSVEQSRLAEHHEARADNLERALDKTVFSDDSDAIEALEARIKENEEKRDRMKLVNALYKKNDAAGLEKLGINIEKIREKLAAAGSYWGSKPHLAYELTNLGARIRSDKQRVEQVKTQNVRKESAQASPNGVSVTQCTGGYVRVTFADKPEREILESLRAAGFYWGGGSWTGKGDALPELVKELAFGKTQPAPIVIKGCPRDKWEEVQAIQHQPFIYIHYNGSRWAGQEEGDIAELLEVLAKYRLDYDMFGPEFYTVNPCAGIRNPEYTYGSSLPEFIDGERLYTCDGVVRFSGNFLELSHAFCIETNHQPTIDALIAAIKHNRSL